MVFIQTLKLEIVTSVIEKMELTILSNIYVWWLSNFRQSDSELKDRQWSTTDKQSLTVQLIQKRKEERSIILIQS